MRRYNLSLFQRFLPICVTQFPSSAIWSATVWKLTIFQGYSTFKSTSSTTVFNLPKRPWNLSISFASDQLSTRSSFGYKFFACWSWFIQEASYVYLYDTVIYQSQVTPENLITWRHLPNQEECKNFTIELWVLCIWLTTHPRVICQKI